MPETIALSYDTLQLPSAQHRAGLAGLLVLRDSLHRRGLGPIPDWEQLPDGYMQITLTRDSLQLLMDDLYQGFWENRTSDKLPASKSARNIEPVQSENASGRPTTRYRYQDYAIKADFYEPFSMPPLWLKLWRDAIWATLRGRPATRSVYRDRADEKPASIAAELWRTLTPLSRRGSHATQALSSTIYIGAQDTTAEGVPFVGRADEAFLLHFWPVVALIGEARRPTFDRKSNAESEESLGYVFAVPDVADFEGFVEDFHNIIAELTPDAHGYRPRDAVLSLPHEGALEYFRHISRLARARAERGVLSYSVTGIEIFQIQQRGKNIALRSTARVTPQPGLIERYEAIHDRYRNSLFRAQMIRNLLDDRPWYHGFDRLFAIRDPELFVGNRAGPFARSVQLRFGAGPLDAASAIGGRDAMEDVLA
jgi:CRISPR-associated protein Cmx8